MIKGNSKTAIIPITVISALAFASSGKALDMPKNMCLRPEALEGFIAVLNPEALDITKTTVTVDGKFVWTLNDEGKFCVSLGTAA